MKQLPRAQVEAVARTAQRVLADDFGGNQSEMARRLRVSQSTVNNVIRGEKRGPGLTFLLALRDWTGTSLDDLLALRAPARPPSEDDLQARVEVAVADAIRRLVAPPDAPRLPAPQGGTKSRKP